MDGSVKITSRPLDAADMKRIDKAERDSVAGTTATIKDIRIQLSEQLKCLDVRLETQQAIVGEFQDIFRRRADIEASYGREMEKLAKYISNRHKEHKQRRDLWPLCSPVRVWEQLVTQTKKEARDHSVLADIYSNHLVQRTNNINEDLHRVYRKCREIGCEIHEEVLKVLHELLTAMRTHQAYRSEFRQSQSKFQVAERQRSKLDEALSQEKREKHRKYKLIDKEYQKRKQKYDDSRLKATKARNEYLLCLDAANASIQKYFVDDLSDLIDCMDIGFHQSLSQALSMHLSGMEQCQKSLQQDVDSLGKALSAMDSRLDKQRFIESNNTTFMIPKKFEYAPVRRDEAEVVVQKVILSEMELRKEKLLERLSHLKTESEEIWKSMETTEKTLADLIRNERSDTTRFFVEENSLLNDDEVGMKNKAELREIQDFYINKFREYVLNSNRIARLQAKYEHIRSTVGDKSSLVSGGGTLTLTQRPNAARRRRIGNNTRQGGQPKLFGGSLEEYLEETNQDLPVVLRSCIRVINMFGLHHQGIFRVSGSQVEINSFRDAFERGDDPMTEMTDASDINSVAGVLKLYFRELREPIFPIQYFDQFMEFAQLESKHEFVLKVRDVVKSWPRAVFVAMRYLFAFLNHLSEFSDENMMDPYNLAVCFGPSLVPIPEDRDQFQYQNLVNELIKNFIIFYEDIFPSNVPGPVYEKYISNEPEDMGEAPPEAIQDEVDSQLTEDAVFQEERDDDMRELSMDLFGRNDTLEAQALYDFKARSSREINFRKGDKLLLYKQVSNDWWRGAVEDREGLIPDKYITIKMRDEDDGVRASEASASASENASRRPSNSSSWEVPFESALSVELPPSRPVAEAQAPGSSSEDLQQQIDEALAQVDAIAKEIEEKKSLSSRSTTATSLGAATKVCSSAGARPKVLHAAASVDSGPQKSHAFLKQASLDARPKLTKEAPNSDVSEGEPVPARPGFRSSRSFWEQQAQKSQTPDLVVDLPPGSAPVPVPKPRTVLTDENASSVLTSRPLRKSSAPSISRQTPLQASANLAGRPQIRVKPYLQGSKSNSLQEE